jgi:FkbM family methyltransferase
MSFTSEIKAAVASSLNCYYGIENHDFGRFGDFVDDHQWRPDRGIFVSFKRTVKRIIRPFVPALNAQFNAEIKRRDDDVELILQEILPYLENLEFVYSNLEPQDKDLYISVIVMRLLGPRKIKLSINNKAYWETIAKVKAAENKNDEINPGFRHFRLTNHHLQVLGIPVKLYYASEGVATTFINEQYAYRKNGNYVVEAAANDYVMDLGGCWGDTALYFANKVGRGGRVFTFEMIPGNIKILKLNIALNPDLVDRIVLVEQPVTGSDNDKLFFSDEGPASHVSGEPFEGQAGEVLSTSIDGFMEKNGVEKLDLIKMDIEGAEMSALIGGLESIKKYRPKLAISIYHSWKDFSEIPKWILDLNLGYKIYFGHHTIHAEESVIYAISEG